MMMFHRHSIACSLAGDLGRKGRCSYCSSCLCDTKKPRTRRDQIEGPCLLHLRGWGGYKDSGTGRCKAEGQKRKPQSVRLLSSRE